MRIPRSERGWPLAVLAALAALAGTGEARGDMGGWTEEGSLPIQPPERAFLLVDAPRRFLPTEQARVRLQLSEGGEVRLALFRVRDPRAALGLAGLRQGVSIARSSLGAEAEALLARDLVRGTELERVSDRWVTLPKPREARRVTDETEVYDSNEEQEDEIATYWVSTGRWSVKEVSLGRLPAGLYLARAHAGPWAATALLSVGDLVLLARRGDTEDLAYVTDADGNPMAGVEVTAEAEGRVIRRGRTGSDGTLRMPAVDEPTLRFVAERAADVAFGDVAHARLSACDPRVYLATGRPTYRLGETIYVRGHVRGCDREGRYVGLADEPVTLHPGGVSARTDADGNFVAEVSASQELTAEIRGQPQARTVRIDHRQLPVRGIQVRADRPFASTGDVLRVEVSDDDGGWPRARDVVLETPAGRFLARIGPGAPATFHVPVPATEAPAERFALHATLADGNRVTVATTEVWIGRSPLLLELDAPRTEARAEEVFPVTLRALDLGGAAASGTIQLTVHGTDGNEPRGPARWTGRQGLSRGAEEVAVPLVGPGPWMVVARHGPARAHLVVWARERPPQLSGRGPLAVAPTVQHVQPGETLRVDVRTPPGRGRAFVTLEQGSVWHSETLAATPGRVTRAEITVPDRARGLAKVVVAHVAGGRVRTATATVDVATSRETTLRLETDRRSYAQSERAKVTLRAHTTDGRPTDAVASLWLADAGYWEMGEETYPLPGEYLRMPGRMASGGDSSQPVAYGAEEGRVLPDAVMEWNGQRVEGTTYRHAWAHYGRIVRVRRQGTLPQIARDLAREAGLRGAWVCPETTRDVGQAALRAHDLPWDLVAVKVSELVGAEAHVADGVLRYECPGGSGMGGGGMGSGGGSGRGMLRTGAARLSSIREERLEGTLHFVGLARLGPDGVLELEVPLPDHPGRWRVEALAIRDDGGGARAHAVVHTQRALELWTDLPARLSPGDEAPGTVHLRAPALAGQRVQLEAQVPLGLALREPLPEAVTLDDRGEAHLPLRLTAREPGEATLLLRARAGGERDGVRARVEVLPDHTEHPVAMRALVGPEALDVHVPLPDLAEPTTLVVQVDAGLRQSIEDALEGLHEPRWHVPSMRVDRLASLRALADAARRLPDDPARRLLETRIAHAHASEAAALGRLVTPGGGVGWWTSLPDSPRLTAEALWALGDGAREPRWEAAWDALRRHAERPGSGGETAGFLAMALARSPVEADRVHARRLLDAAVSGDPRGLARLVVALGAAQALEDREKVDALSASLEQALRARVVEGGEMIDCRGPVWLLCHARWGERADVARAATALLDARDDARPLAIEVIRWLARRGPVEQRWVWGSAEADVLALAARVLPARADRGTSFGVTVDGQRVDARHGRVTVPAGARDLRLVFDARAGRLLRLRVDGTVRTRPPVGRTGNVELARRFEGRYGLWALVVELALPRSSRGVDVVVPIPAGLDLSADARAPDGARMALADGAMELRFDRLSAGRRTIRLPLVRLSAGSFHAGAARLRDAGGTRWAVTPATVATVD